MKKSIIVAMTTNRVIGYQNKLPWHMPADMRYFKTITQGHPVIMGRKTFESMGKKPLSKRTNIIVSRNEHLCHPKDCYLCPNLKEAFQKAEETGAEEAFVIGGSQIYAQAIPMVDTLYITEIRTDIEGDTYFPPFNINHWEEISRINHNPDEGNPYGYAFLKYMRKIQSTPRKVLTNRT